MDTSVNNSLLALMLALNDLQSPLSEDEESTLSSVADRLALEPDTWESDIEPDLLAVIKSNSNFNQLFQNAKSQLDAVNGEIPKDLLPTHTELEKVIPAEPEIATRGFEPEAEESDLHSNEISNMVINILSNPNPSETTKKLDRFEQLKQFLRQPAKAN